MISNDVYLYYLFHWIFPFALMLGAFIMLIEIGKTGYEKMDVDKLWKSLVKAGIICGIIAMIWVFVTRSQWFYDLTGYARQGANWVNSTEIAQNTQAAAMSKINLFINFLSRWIPIYFRAFVIVWGISIVVLIRSLLWRVNFYRGANIILLSFIMYPILVLKYFFGYETPFFDFIHSRLLVAKVKENLNDSYFDALQGYDDKGRKFKDGAGGSAQTQRIKSTALATRRTRAVIRTAGGTRHAELVIRNSRETDTDKQIEMILKGFGQRITAQSIRFQDDPELNPERGGFIFDSDVPFNAGDQLGSFRAIFSNPFALETRLTNGGVGALKSFIDTFKEFVDYFLHLTPTAVYGRIQSLANRRYALDTSDETAKYIAQRNLDLSVVPVPVDPETGNSIEVQKANALKVAQERVGDITNALNSLKLRGTFDSVVVGGNVAIYKFTLPKTTNLPTDYGKVQESLANMLKTTNVPIINISAGSISVSMVNGVNVPVDFRRMIENRPKGLKEIISGISGVDALGNNIPYELTDSMPHAMLFGKTGTGKTVTIMTILYSIMDAVDPSMLRIAYVDGKGNSFEFMRTDNQEDDIYHGNPFTYAQPADASGDIDYARALLKHVEHVVRQRVDLFKKSGGLSNITNYNKKYPNKKLPRILVVVDEFSAITDQDKLLKEGFAEKNVTDIFEYIAKMGRSTGVHLLLANQTARKQKVEGRITANIGGRLSLGVTERIESEIAMPDCKIALNKIEQPGEFYSLMNSLSNPDHGNSPYLPDEVMFDLNDSLEKKFGHNDYVYTREEIMEEMEVGLGLEVGETRYEMPSPMPTQSTPINELIEIIGMYPEWAVANRNSLIFTDHDAYIGVTPKVMNERKEEISRALLNAENRGSAPSRTKANTRKSAGAYVSDMVKGKDRGTM